MTEKGKTLEIRAECDYHHVKIMLETHGGVCIGKESKKEEINIPPGYLNIEREIYELKKGSLKFQIDKVKGVGNFVEIKPTSMDNGNAKNFTKHCEFYLGLFSISKEHIISESYKEMYKKMLGISQ